MSTTSSQDGDTWAMPVPISGEGAIVRTKKVCERGAHYAFVARDALHTATQQSCSVAGDLVRDARTGDANGNQIDGWMYFRNYDKKCG